LNLIFKPAFGGALVELDDRGLSRNLSDVLSRREESYHRQKLDDQEEGKSIHQLSKKLPPGAESLLRYDWHPRYSLLDHFLHPRTRLEDFKSIHYGEQGDFVNQEYDLEFQPGEIVLSRLGHIWVGDESVPLKLSKRIRPRGGAVEFLYDFENLTDLELALLFGSEWNFYLLAGEWEISKGSLFLLSGRWRMEYSPPPEIWHFPLETLSQSEEGYDIIRQGVCFLPHWRLHLSGRQKFSLAITWKEGS
jgi:alpha-amylase